MKGVEMLKLAGRFGRKGRCSILATSQSNGTRSMPPLQFHRINGQTAHNTYARPTKTKNQIQKAESQRQPERQPV
jgi:hypothetical protein